MCPSHSVTAARLPSTDARQTRCRWAHGVCGSAGFAGGSLVPREGAGGRRDEEPNSTSSPAADGPRAGRGHACPFRRYCCSGPAVLVVTSSVEPSSVAGTGTLWAGGVVAGFSPGGGQMGAVVSRGPEERMMTLSSGSGGGVGTQGQNGPARPGPPAGQPSGGVEEGSLRVTGTRWALRTGSAERGAKWGC